MAREEHRREDLLHEATALVDRVEVRLAGDIDPIVAGFRSDNSASFYFDEDLAYQFNSHGQFRRGHFDGRLYKAQSGRLHRLTRRRTANAVELERHELTASEAAEFLGEAQRRLRHLTDALANDEFHLLGQVSPSGDIIARLLRWIAQLPAEIAIADSPRAG